ncbi:MAG: imidazole glycerol phosphate synthase subunit HisF [Spirochaetota bacterium]|nr:imidazole glycerol phosphate synthase subunit HisF [Spirochaetota bacterium]
MQEVKIIPCLDMKNGRVVKGIHFVNLRDAGDPVECASLYCREGADEIAFLDISATLEGRKTLIDIVSKTAAAVTVPFIVGGGIGEIDDIRRILDAGATRVSISSAAFKNPGLVADAVREYGSDSVIVAIDVDFNPDLPSGYEVYIKGGTEATGKDAIQWAAECTRLGAGQLLPTSKAADGTRDGYDIKLLRMMADATGLPVIASGGAGTLEHFYEAATEGKASSLLAASVFHFRTFTIGQVKEYLSEKGIPVALDNRTYD